MNTDLPLAGTDDCTMYDDRFCELCGQVCKGGGPDACLGTIPGVSHACCGHGKSQPYVVIGGRPNQACHSNPHRTTLRDQHATIFFDIIRQARQLESTQSLARVLVFGETAERIAA